LEVLLLIVNIFLLVPILLSIARFLIGYLLFILVLDMHIIRIRRKRKGVNFVFENKGENQSIKIKD